MAPDTAGRTGWLGGTWPKEPLLSRAAPPLLLAPLSDTPLSDIPFTSPAVPPPGPLIAPRPPPLTPGEPKSPECSSEYAGAYPCSCSISTSAPPTPMSIPPIPKPCCASHSPSASSCASALAAAAVPGGTGEFISRGAEWNSGTGGGFALLGAENAGPLGPNELVCFGAYEGCWWWLAFAVFVWFRIELMRNFSATTRASLGANLTAFSVS